MTVAINEYMFFPPDWSSIFSYKREWKTSIQRSITSYEKRSGLFTWPRRTLQYSVKAFTAAENNFIQRSLYKYMHGIWGVPVWFDRTTLISQASSGQAILNVASTTNKNFEVGGKCVLLVDRDTYEAGTILSLTSTSITLDTNLAGTWDSGTKVYPILKATLSDKLKVPSKSNEVSTYKFVFSEEPDPDITHNLHTNFVFPIYKTYVVFNKSVNWLKPVSTEFSHPIDAIKYLGPSYRNNKVDETILTLSSNFTNFSQSEMYETLGIFDDCMGMLYPFWVPSNSRDVILTSAVVNTDTTINIEDIKWSSYWDGDIIGQHLIIYLPNGSEIYREVVSAPSSTELTLDSAIGVDISANEIPFTRISFLFFVRFTSDAIEFKMPSINTSEFDSGFVTLNGVTL